MSLFVHLEKNSVGWRVKNGEKVYKAFRNGKAVEAAGQAGYLLSLSDNKSKKRKISVDEGAVDLVDCKLKRVPSSSKALPRIEGSNGVAIETEKIANSNDEKKRTDSSNSICGDRVFTMKDWLKVKKSK